MNRYLRFATLVCLVLLCGCIGRSENGSTVTIGYELWVPLLTFLGGFAATPFGWFARGNRIGMACLFLGPLVALVFAPSLLNTKAVVREDGFKVTNGIWGMTAGGALNYEDIDSLTMTSEESRGRRGRRKQTTYANFSCNGQEDVKLPVANGVMKEGMAEIIARLTAQGIPVIDRT